MKYLNIFVPLFTMLLFLSCDELEELLEEEIDIPISFAGDLNIVSESSVSEPTDPITVQTEFAIYRINDDPDIAEIISDPSEISKIKINRIRYSYKDFEGNEESLVIEAGFIFVNQNMSVSQYEILDTGVNVSEADFRNDAFVLEDDFSEVENGFQPGFPTVSIKYFGTLSHNPVYFTVGITVDATVTIKPDIDNF